MRADQVRVSVIPFGQYVNVGLGNRTQPWLDVPADHPGRRSPASCRMAPGGRRPGAVPARSAARPARAPAHLLRTTAGPYQCGSAAQPARWVNQCTNIRGAETWSSSAAQTAEAPGCAGTGASASRAHPDDTRDSNYGVRIPGLMNVGCGIAPSSSRRNNLPAAKVAHHVADDQRRNLHSRRPALGAGAAVSPHAPIGGARAARAGSRVRRYIVLVTDGQNTRSPTHITPRNNRQATPHAPMRSCARTCRNLAADTETDATLFTIAFEGLRHVGEGDPGGVLPR